MFVDYPPFVIPESTWQPNCWRRYAVILKKSNTCTFSWAQWINSYLKNRRKLSVPRCKTDRLKKYLDVQQFLLRVYKVYKKVVPFKLAINYCIKFDSSSKNTRSSTQGTLTVLQVWRIFKPDLNMFLWVILSREWKCFYVTINSKRLEFSN